MEKEKVTGRWSKWAEQEKKNTDTVLTQYNYEIQLLLGGGEAGKGQLLDIKYSEDDIVRETTIQGRQSYSSWSENHSAQVSELKQQQETSNSIKF